MRLLLDGTLVGMDAHTRVLSLCVAEWRHGSDPEGKVARLLDFSNRPRDISDPWYTDDFDTAYDDILEGCPALLRHIRKENGI